jgi:hypothetical protein
MNDTTNKIIPPTVTPALCRNALTLARGEIQSDAEPPSAEPRQKAHNATRPYTYILMIFVLRRNANCIMF